MIYLNSWIGLGWSKGDKAVGLKRSKGHSTAYAGAAARLCRIRGVRSLRRDRESETDGRDRKSTRLNSSHGYISYAVFCLKKKNTSIAKSTIELIPQPLRITVSVNVSGWAT